MKRTILKTEAGWLRTDPDTQSFVDTVRAACDFHERRGLGKATHCSVHPDEPGRIGRVGDVAIITNPMAGLHSFCAHRREP